ncbi:hypothetical protein FJZ53_07575, partial [Candidatus Woesearchaeota archaeon]|nr:hypothetical protein [Candidatus Woesearchaeota archaeon]
MKIPQVFLLDKPSENKLENLLKEKNKIRKISPYEYECYCNICGDIAGSIKIVFGKALKSDHSQVSCWPTIDWLDFQGKEVRYEEPKLLIRNFYGTIEVRKDEKFLESIIIDLNKKDLKNVYKKLDGNYLTFYDLDEDKCYCWTHFKDYLERK